MSVSSQANVGTGNLSVFGGTLQVTRTSSFAQGVTIDLGGLIAVDQGKTATFSGFVNGSGPPADLKVGGGGTLALTNTTNDIQQTSVTGNSEVIASADGSLGVLGTGNVNLGDASNGGTLGFANSFSTSRNFVLGTGGGTIDTVGAGTSATALSGVVSGFTLALKVAAELKPWCFPCPLPTFSMRLSQCHD